MRHITFRLVALVWLMSAMWSLFQGNDARACSSLLFSLVFLEFYKLKEPKE